MAIVLVILAIIFGLFALACTDNSWEFDGLGFVMAILAVVCMGCAATMRTNSENARLDKEHARIEKQVNVPELNKYYAYNTQIQDNGKTIVIETEEDASAGNIAKIKDDLSKSDKIKDVQFMSNSDKHAKIILIVKLK